MVYHPASGRIRQTRAAMSNVSPCNIKDLVRIATYCLDLGSIAAVDWPQRSDLLLEKDSVLP